MSRDLAGLLRAIRQRLSRPIVWRRRLLYDYPLTGPLPDVQPRIPVDWVTKPHPDWAARGAGDDAAMMLYAFYDGAEIYHSEAITDRAYVRRLFPACDLGPRPVYHGDAVTDPKYRGNLLHPAGMTFVYQYYRERGYTKVLCRVRPDNAASLASMRRAGYRLCAEAHHIALLGFEFPPVGRRLREHDRGEGERPAPAAGGESTR
jgi:GNAT superfamily N-acetyltransferase